MKATNIIITACIGILGISSCSQKPHYEIIDRRGTPSGDTAYVVYTPDTNWVEMESFAMNLMKNNKKWSGVGFFNPRDKALKLNPNYSIPRQSWDYIVASYRYDEEMKKFNFHKSDNRFRKDMKFEN